MTTAPVVLVLGGTGRTGQLIAHHLTAHGLQARTASRHGSDIVFDWDDPATYDDALRDAASVYLVTPVGRVRFAGQVAAFLDRAEAAGVRHVTLLSTFNGDRVPREIDTAAVEEDLVSRTAFTHTILRPAWVMQNFTDEHLPIINGVLAVPSRGGAEAFVDAADIAAVAAETLLDPHKHIGAAYALTGPQAITFADATAIIASVSGRPVTYVDVEQQAWIDGAVAAGVPDDYAAMLRWLTSAIIDGNGSTPTEDITTVLGRPAISFGEFAQRNAAAWPLREEQ